MEEIEFNLDLNRIYLSLSEEAVVEFDKHNYLQHITEVIDRITPEKYKFMQNEELITLPMLINQNLVAIIKEVKDEKEFNPSLIFLTYCSYFDLNERKCYLLLHEKVQKIIKKSAASLLGDKIMQKMRRREVANRGYAAPNLFEMFGL